MIGSYCQRSIWILALLFQLLDSGFLALSQETLLESAKQAYFKGDFQELDTKLDALLKESPEQPAVNILQGLTLLHGGKIEDILQGKELIEKHARRQPDDPFSNYALGILYKEQDIQRSARKYFLKALENDDEMVAATGMRPASGRRRILPREGGARKPMHAARKPKRVSSLTPDGTPQ